MIQKMLRETMIGALVIFPNHLGIIPQWGNRSYSGDGDDFRQDYYFYTNFTN
jgi:hypothetical protein